MSHEKPLLDVLQNRLPKRRPIWLMRQAGRYLPEYRKVRAEAGSFLSLCYNPVNACEVTLQPLRRFDLDAAILFSDILVVPHAMGLALDFRENEGPVLDTVRDLQTVKRLKIAGRFEAFEKVSETVALISQALGPGKTLIGFCGAPWTVASYMIEGGTSKRMRAKAVAEANESWFGELITRLVDVSVLYLQMQIAAGAEVIQIFDSWAGDLSHQAQLRWVDAPIAEMRARLKISHPDIPVIVFARGVGSRHGEIARSTHADAVSVEQDRELADVLVDVPDNVAVQGNLDPALLHGAAGDLIKGIERVLQQVPMHRHIFNLGHGIVPKTPPEMVGLLVETVRKHDALQP
jgi:uroporphyrinogen decarboxylase